MKVEHLLCVNGHTERIWCIAWSPTENIFATCSADRKVKIWRFIKDTLEEKSCYCALDSPNCGKEYRVELEFSIDNVFKKTVRSVRFSNDGKFLVCASFDGTTSIWTRADNKDSTPYVTPESALPDYTLVNETSLPLDSEDRTVVSDQDFQSIPMTGESKNHSISTSSRTDVWKYVSILQGHENEVKCAAFDSSGVYIATCGRDKTIWIYEKSHGNEYDEDLNKIEGSDSPVEYFCSAILSGHRHDVKYVCWNPSALLLASASYDNTVKLWTIKDNDWRCIQTLSLHTNTVWSLSFNFNGTILASCSADKNLFIYESETMRSFLNSHSIAKPSLFFSWTRSLFPNYAMSKKLEAFTYAPIVADDWELKRSYNELHSRPIYTLDFGDLILTGGGDNAIKITKPEGRSEVIEINGHTSDVNSVAWKPFQDTGIFASVGDDDYIRFWRLS